MSINEHFVEYTNKMAELLMYQRSIKKIANSELTELYEYSERHKENQKILDSPLSVHNFIFYGAKDGLGKRYATKVTKINDKHVAIILHKNKQYQWLLAEAYEAYEDFIEQAYAHVGFIDQNSWPMSDFGNITIPELKDKDYDYFQMKSREKKGKPHSMLNRLRQIFPDYEKYELNNELEQNLKLLVFVAESLRHQIVHTGGKVLDQKEFIETVLKKYGTFNNGNYDKDDYEYIAGFFGGEEYANTIMLLEIQIEKNFPANTEINRLEVLTSALMADAHLLAEEIQKKGKIA